MQIHSSGEGTFFHIEINSFGFLHLRGQEIAQIGTRSFFDA